MGFWAALLDTFRNHGDWNALKEEFISLSVHDIIANNLQAVRAALVDIEFACRAQAIDSFLSQFRPLFASLLVMISAGEDRGEQPTTWEQVRMCLAADHKAASDKTCLVQNVVAGPVPAH